MIVILSDLVRALHSLTLHAFSVLLRVHICPSGLPEPFHSSSFLLRAPLRCLFGTVAYRFQYFPCYVSRYGFLCFASGLGTVRLPPRTLQGRCPRQRKPRPTSVPSLPAPQLDRRDSHDLRAARVHPKVPLLWKSPGSLPELPPGNLRPPAFFCALLMSRVTRFVSDPLLAIFCF